MSVTVAGLCVAFAGLAKGNAGEVADSSSDSINVSGWRIGAMSMLGWLTTNSSGIIRSDMCCLPKEQKT